MKAGNQLRDRMAQKQQTLKTQQASGGQSGMANDPGKTRAQIQFLKNKRVIGLESYQKLASLYVFSHISKSMIDIFTFPMAYV